jgi:hypothetical protein
MNTPITLCGQTFSPELIEELNERQKREPKISNTALAQIICEHLGWYTPNGRHASSSAKVALRKLRKRGVLSGRSRRRGSKRRHRLRRSQQPLPEVSKVPKRVDKVRGLELVVLSGHKDPLHGLWNDLIIDQHPCGDAPLVGSQLRYLIRSDHGWLGALGFGPAAFVLGARDVWIGWTPAARVSHLNQVVGLSRFLIREEVRCTNLASKVLSLALKRLAGDWEGRYGLRPLLVETFVDRTRFTGRCFSAANWRRIGSSSGRGRLGPRTLVNSRKDIWVYPLSAEARHQLQEPPPRPLSPCGLTESLAQPEWWVGELDGLELGDQRRNQRAQAILEARWKQPQASFYGSFDSWAQAKGAYGLIEHRSAPLSLQRLLSPHTEATQARMAAEGRVILAQDTTTLNFSGLKQTCGLGPLGEEKGRGLWLHSLLAYRPDGIGLGVLEAQCWARSESDPEDARGRNAKSIDEKESGRWVQALHTAGEAARRMPQTEVVVMSDREGDLYELHDAVRIAPANLHILIRAQHDRNLVEDQKLWSYMEDQPPADRRIIELPRRRGQPARKATLELRWAPITIEAPKVGCKKGWPSVSLWALWAHEPNPPEGVEALDWMLLTDEAVHTLEQAWERVQWYRVRWGIEEWHRVLKSGCNAEGREFKSAEHLQRVLAFDLIVAWRILACVKLGRTLPQLPARVLYTEEELAVLHAYIEKKLALPPPPNSPSRRPTDGSPALQAIPLDVGMAPPVHKALAWDCDG